MSFNIIYHILIDRFNGCHESKGVGFKGGNIRGIIEKLDYIQRLGADAILLSPFFSTAAYHGYHCTTAENEIEIKFGDKKDLCELTREVHQRGMSIIADFVPNHCHATNPLFADNNHRDWFYYESNDIEYRCFANLPELPMLNLDNISARNYMINQAELLCSWGFDALRIDHATGPSYSFLKELRTQIHNKYPKVLLIGEVVGKDDFVPKEETYYNKRTKRFGAQEARQMEYVGILDGVLDYRYYDIIRKALANNESFNDNNPKLKQKIQQHFKNYPSDFSLWLFLDNHDVNRILCLCNGNINTLKSIIRFTKQWNKPLIVFYGTEKGVYNKTKLSRKIPYDDERVRPCMDWSSSQVIKSFKNIL